MDVLEVIINLDDENGLNALYFTYNGGYISLSRLEEESDLYLEKDDQSFGSYVSLNCVKYQFENKRLSLEIKKELAEIIKSPTLIVLSLSKEKIETLNEINETLIKIFK